MTDDSRRVVPGTLVEIDQTPPVPASPASIELDDDLPAIDPSRYEIEGEHARGGLGRVMRARDHRLKRRVAVKQLAAPGERADQRFVREAYVTARLQHPSIVPIYDAGRSTGGAPFYAMKMVDGRTLAAIIEETATLDARMGLLPNMIAIVEAIAYAHSEGVIHRDLKPSNVLVGSFGETVVVDWGLAKDLRATDDDGEDPAVAPASDADLTVVGTVMGTPAYIPPEQATGHAVDERADVYALGAILYHLLAGVPPYRGADSKEVLARVLAGPPAAVDAEQPGVAVDLATIVDKAMARAPGDRYASARELAVDLRRFQTGQLVGAHHYTRRTLLWRWLVRHRAVVAVAAVLTTILAVTGAYSVRRILREREATQARNNELILLQATSALDHDPTAAIEWLKTYPRDARDWTTAATIAADAQSRGVAMHVLRGPDVNVYQLAWSPDGRSIAAAGSDGTIRAWDPVSGASLGVADTGSPLYTVAFSADGAIVAGGNDDGDVVLWRRSDDTRRVLFGDAAVRSVEVSPDGRSIAAADASGAIALWDIATGDRRALGAHQGGATGVHFSTDGSLVVSAGTDGVGVWPVSTTTGRVLTGHADVVTDVAIARDGQMIASSSLDGTVRLWDVATGESRALTGHTRAVYAVAISPDGQVVASVGDDNTARLWDARTGTERLTLRGHDKMLDTVSFAADGTRIAASGMDGVISVWDVESGARQTLLGHVGWAGVRFSPRDDRIVSGGHDLDVRVWHPPQRPARTLTGNQSITYAVAACPADRFVSASADGTVRLFDDATGAGRVIDHHADRIERVLCAPDGAFVASIGFDGAARVVELANGAARVLADRGATDIALSPDGRTLAIGGGDAIIQLVETRTWTARPLPVRGAVVALAFTPDGTRLAVATADGTLEEWDPATATATPIASDPAGLWLFAYAPDGAQVAWVGHDHAVWLATAGTSRLVGHPGEVLSIAFSTDGGRLAATTGEHLAIVWALDANRHWELPHGDLVQASLFLSPDLLVTGSNDGAVIYWNLADGSRHVYREGGGYVRALAASADGATVASAGSDPEIRVWAMPREWSAADPRSSLEAVTTATLTGTLRP